MIDISEIFTPITLNKFASEYWGENEFFSEKKHDILTNLITFEDIKEYLTTSSFYQQATVLLRSNSFSVDETQPQSLADVMSGIEKGLTLQVRNLQKVLPHEATLMQLTKQLEKILITPLDSITLFYSLPNSEPTAIHKDIGEIFSIQISGKKRWKIANKKCLTDQMSFVEGEITDWEYYLLEAGNMMYLPSYLPHQVKCIQEASTSVALVFRNIQFENVLYYLKEDPILREWLIKPLPFINKDVQDQATSNKLDQFLGILANKALNFDKVSMMNDLSVRLSDYHIK
jgi:ribosomal protein L16 Arg81 hydroxylase